MQKPNKNPILKYIGGKAIRQTNKITLTYHYREYEKLVEQSQLLNIPVSQVILLKSGPCPHCKCDKIVIPLTPAPKHKHIKEHEG